MEKTVKETNALIAEFMGRKFHARKGNSSYTRRFNTYKECEDWIKSDKVPEGYKPVLIGHEDLGEYHNSWNWIMPVVEKIGVHPDFTNTPEHYSLNNTIYQLGFYTKKSTKSINDLYESVVAFIKMSNEKS